MAAVNGEKLKDMKAVIGTEKIEFAGFAETYKKLQPAMDTLRGGGDPNIPPMDLSFHFEKTGGKLKDEFNIFRGRLTPEKVSKGNPHDDGDDDDSKSKGDKPDFDADFDVTEDEEEEKDVEDVAAPDREWQEVDSDFLQAGSARCGALKSMLAH